MRVFWISVGLAILIVGGWLFRRGRTPGPPPAPVPAVSSVSDSPRPGPAAESPPVPMTPSVGTPAVPTKELATDEIPPRPAPASTVAPPATPAAAPIKPEVPPSTKGQEPPGPPSDAKAKADPAPAEGVALDLNALLGIDDPLAPKAEPAKSQPSNIEPAGAPSPKPPSAVPAAPAAPTSPLKLEPQDDGTTLVDGKYVIKGKGTKEDPYRVTWEMLISAEETYRPRLGMKVIPERLKMIDGKWVRISGFVAFPIMAQSPDEMLMMLNQWDGCCIGLPPTPYDAVEVRLKKGAEGDERLRTSGTVNGVLHVDPYLVKDWLVSLYLMDNAELVEAAGAKDPTQHIKQP